MPADQHDDRRVEHFAEHYRQGAPWEIGRAQAEVVRLADEGKFTGAVLDVGCGTGENALMLASCGLEVWGIDFVPEAIAAARAKAHERGLQVTFEVLEVLRAGELGRTFDAALDCGLFHIFPPSVRPRYAAAMHAALRPGGMLYLLCFSEHETRADGPKRITQQEIREAFRDGWAVEDIHAIRFEAWLHEGGSRGWLASIRRI